MELKTLYFTLKIHSVLPHEMIIIIIAIYMNPDLVILCETHLKDNDKISMNEYYKVISHNRKVRPMEQL